MGGHAKRNAVKSHPLVRFRTKSGCGTNGKPVRKSRGAGRPFTGGRHAAQVRNNAKPDVKKAKRAQEKEARALFRFCSKTYGLTYSDAAGIESKEVLHEFLQKLIGVHHLCVSRELHANDQPHYHCAARCDHKVETTDCHMFDYTDTHGNVYHPNIVKGGPAWLNYVKKDGDIHSNFPERANVMAEALACTSTERALDHIMSNDAGSYVRFGSAIENNLRRHFTRACTARVPRWSGPYPSGRYPIDWNPHTHAGHMWGPPGSGKTCFAQHILREYFGDCEYIKCHVDALKSLTFTKPFVFDEAMFLDDPASVSREITDVVSGGTIAARYHAINIPPGIPRIFVSNSRYVFKNPDDSVYGRRLQQWEHPFSCRIEEWRLHNPPQDIRPPPRPPSPVPPPPPGTPPSRGNSPPPPPPDVDAADNDTTGMVTEPDDHWPGVFSRWEEALDDYLARPRPSQAPAIGAAPMPLSPMVPMPATPHWSPGWSPLLPYDDVFDMDIDLFEDTLVMREDL